MEGLLNKAELIIEKSHDILVQGMCSHLFHQPLFSKLADIYAEEAAKPLRLKSVSQTHKLLDKLVKRDKLNCLVVKLYRGNEGYSLAVKMGSGIETETVRLQYGDDEFLSYLDNEQLPPMLLDLLDDTDVDIFYSGCIITEIRDYRRSLDTSFDSKYILLRPTTQSIVADVAALTREGDWTPQEKLLLEAEIVRKSAPPLNLCPSPLIGIINNKIHLHKFKFSGVPLRRAARRFSQVSQNRQKKLEEGPPPKSLRLHAFLSSLSEKDNKYNLAKNVPKPTIPIVVEDSADSNHDNFEMRQQHSEPNLFYHKISEDVKRIAQPMDRPQDTMDNSLVFVEEYTLETERGQGRIYLTKLTISQRRTDEIYFGELYVDRDYQEGKQNGSTCRFQLGTLHQVRRYIQQFKEILTEEGRKSVKITHKPAGQPARTISTPGTRDKKDYEQLKQQHLQLQQQQQQQQQQEQHAQTQQQLQHLPQSILTSFNLTGPQPVSLSVNTAGVVAPTAVTIAQPSPQNVIIVSNTDGAIKKSVNVVGKPITVTSSASLSSLIASPSVYQQTGTQPVVLGRSVNLSSLLSGRSVVGNGGGTMTVAGSVPQGTKLAVVTTGQGITKFSLPTLAAQLSRPAPSYSQAISTVKSQVADVSVQAQVKGTNEGISSASSTGTSNLQALLTGPSSAENQSTHNRSAALFERLSAVQSPALTNAKDENLGSPLKITATTNISAGATGALHGGPNAVVTGVGPPNINLANLANIPGINMGLQSLASNLQGVQNVQMSIPGLVPICLSLNVPANNTPSTTVVASSPMNVATKTTGTSVVSTAATVMIANQSGLQQGQVVQLPLGSQLAAQLTKSAGQGGSVTSSIPVLQVQGVGGPLFTSLRSSSGATISGPVSSSSPAILAQQAVPVSVAVTQSLSTSSPELSLGSLTHASLAPTGSSIVTLTSKQPVQLTMAKQQGALTWQLTQKLRAAKRQQQQQQHNQAPK